MYIVKYIGLFLLCFSSAYANEFRRQADYHYDGVLNFEADKGFIEAEWDITLLEIDKNEVTFYVRDTVQNIKVSGEVVLQTNLSKVSGFQDFWAISITLDPNLIDRKSKFSISYSGILLPTPLPNKINTINGDVIELNVDSFWFPIDASFSKQITADLTINGLRGWNGLSTGDVSAGENAIYINNHDPRIDIAFTLARNAELIRRDGYMFYDLRQNNAGLDALLDAINHCKVTLNKYFGATNSLPETRFVVTDRPESGYARENYIVFTDIAATSPENLTLFVCHELAHYWASGADFTGVDNWINEAFAEFAGLIGVREKFDKEMFAKFRNRFSKQIEGKNLPRVWQAGDTARGSYLVQYRKAPLLLAGLEDRIGTERFLNFMTLLLNQRQKTTSQLLDTLELVTSKQARDDFEADLAK